jgi:hypothetical protein
MTTEATLLDRLRAAWNAPQEAPESHITHSTKLTTVEPLSLSVANLEAVRRAGVAVDHCELHLPPFDALEEPDYRRLGYIRSTCRICGAFLGYRRGAVGIDLPDRS